MILVVAALFVAGVGAPAFAEKAVKKTSEQKYERIVASIVSIDPKTKTINVTREENGESRTVVISDKALAQVHVGDRVRIKLKPGTNESVGLRILGAKPVADAGTAAPAAAAEPAAKAVTK